MLILSLWTNSPKVSLRKALFSFMQETLGSLKPREVVSDEGSHHLIYTFQIKGKPVEILFYSPNELPLVEKEIEDKFVVINASGPKWRTKEEWEDFSLRTIKASANDEQTEYTHSAQVKASLDSGRAFYFVEASPKAILETALQLGAEPNQKITSSLLALDNNRTDGFILRLIDQVTAANLLEEDGSFKNYNHHEGEVLLLLSLLGDQKAQKILETKSAALHNLDRKATEHMAQLVAEEGKNARSYLRRQGAKKAFPDTLASLLQPDVESEPKKMGLDDLICVHATRYLPTQSNRGYEVQSTFDGSGSDKPRISIHWALNHVIQQTDFNSWENAPYVILAPTKKLLEANGPALSLSSVDSFWQVNPGQKFLVPKEGSALLAPDNLPDGEIIQGLSSNIVYYKAKAFTPNDISALAHQLNDKDKTDFNSELLSRIRSSFSIAPLEGEVFLSSSDQARLLQATDEAIHKVDVLNLLQERSIPEVVTDILSKAGIEVSQQQLQQISQGVESRLSEKVKQLAVNLKISQLGYGVKNSGQWGWGGSDQEQYQLKALAAEIGIPILAHTGHISSRVEEHLGVIKDIMLGKTKGYDEPQKKIAFLEGAKKSIRKEDLPWVTPKLRRALYLLGLI